ncbi:MAG: PAS domain-containing protein [Verrucomicrobia bacterium]|nr:PAS domain-containing protein [Verrucomicrobiota bacterium]
MPSPTQAPDRLFLHAMLESSPDHIYFKDTESRFLRINRALARYFGLNDPSEAIGKTDFDFHSPEKAAVRFQDERSIMETGTPIIDKIELEAHRDGKTAWVLTSKSPLCDEQGNLIGTFGISRDITLLKEMEDALGKERNLLRAVVDNVPDFIFAKDTHGRYTLNNLAHARFLGKETPEEVFGMTPFDLLPPAAAELVHADDVSVWKSHAPLLNKIESPVPERWLATSKIPIFDTKGAITGLVGISREITEQKRAQEALEKSNAELQQSREELVLALEELRTVQLQLIEAEKMKLVGRLAAGVAHEVKNPLAIIRMGLEYLKSQTFGDKIIPSVLEEIGGAVQRADSVIGELLDFSAPKKMNKVPVDVNRLIRNALMLVRGEIAARKVVVEEELALNLPPVRLDAMKIEQVLVNVLTNAAHVMEEGGKLTVRTSTRQVTGIGANISQSNFRPGGRLLIIEVLDTGPGVPEALLGKVFEPFFTTQPTGKGTGLGLTVTKTIVDLHGGTIEMKNRPEGGACVTIILDADTD